MHAKTQARQFGALMRRWPIWTGVSFVAALAAALGVRQLPVEVSLDLDSSVTGVTARWPEGERALALLDDAWSPHHYRVRVTAPGTAERALGGGYQMIVMASVDRVTFSDPSLWSQISTYFLLHGVTRPAEIELEGWTIGPHPYLSFEMDPVSETVLVQSADDVPQSVVLQNEERVKVRVPIRPDARRYRYTGTVPRHALPHLELDLAGSARPEVHRLYVNTLIPRIYYGSAPPPRTPAGFLQRDWVPQFKENRILIPSGFVLGGRFVPTVLALWACLLGTLLLLAVTGSGFYRVLCALWREIPANRFEGPLPLKIFVRFWFPVFAIWSFFLFCFYPGTMNADSVNQWSEIQRFQFTTQHPPIYACLMWLGACLWDSPATTALFQILAGSLVVGWAFTLLWKAGVPRGIVLLFYVLAVFSPRNNTAMISLVKDTPYGIALMGMAVCLAWFLLQPSRANRFRWACAGLSLGIAAVFRHNGPMVAFAMLPLTLLYFPRYWRAGLLLLAAFCTVFIGVKQGLYPRLSIEQGDGGLHDLTTCHLAILLDRDVPLHSEEYAFLSQVRDLEDRWGYHPRRGDSTTLPFLECYHRAWAKEHRDPYFQRYRDIVSRNLLNATLYFLERGEFLYVPWQSNDYMEAYFLGISRNDLGLWSTDLLIEFPLLLRAALEWTAQPSVAWLFWRPALPLYLVIAACIAVCIRQRSLAWSIVYAPVLINTATIALAAISQASRYQYPLTLVSGFLIALAFLPPPSKPKEAPQRQANTG